MTAKNVIVVWSTPESLEEGIINCISAHYGTRVYEKDKLDSRITMGDPSVPYFETMDSALLYMYRHPRKCVQLELSVAHRNGLA